MTLLSLNRRLFRTSWAGLLIAVVLAGVFMSFVSKTFLSPFNLYVLTRDVATTLLIGLAQMIVLAIGQMNLSLGSIGGLTVVISGGLMVVWHWPVGAAVAAGLLVGVLAGLINGVLVVRTGINSFIVTIATSSVYLGLNLGMTQAQPFYHLPKEIAAFGQARIGFVPSMLAVTVPVAIMMAVFLHRMVLGRQILAAGGNWNAAQTAGVPVNRAVILAHVISGGLAATAGLMWMAQLAVAQPMIGSTWLLPSFATPIIGGVALSGGDVSIIGTVLAAFVVALIQNSLVHLQIDPYYVQFLLGLLILGAVGLNRLSQRRKIERGTV